MNYTLFNFGFTKRIETKSGKLFDVTAGLPKTIAAHEKTTKCEVCHALFSGEKYLDTHMRFKHQSEYQSPCQGSQDSYITINSSKDIEDSDSQASQQQFCEITQERCSVNAGELKETNSMDVNSTNSRRRGANIRKSYTIDFKLQTLDLLDTLKELKTKNIWKIVAERRGISKSLVVKWNKDRSKIKDQLNLNKSKKNKGIAQATRLRRKILHGGKHKTERFPLAAQRVVVEFKLRRARGCKISKLWLKKKMKEKIAACYGKEEAEKFKASNNWFYRFRKRHNIAFRKRTNKKKCSADDGRETIQRFHRNLRKALKTRRRRNNAVLDSKYGRWLPHNRYNVDQVPLPFVIDQDKTYEVKGSEQVWVSQPSSGLDKRQATLQLCIRAQGEQNVKPAIVFRGKGNVQAGERAEYDESVDVYFQSSAWMDSSINMQWVEKTLVPGVGRSAEEKVIFLDNVSFQQEQQFHDACRRELNAIVYLLPENHTDKIQPIDAGFGKMFKTKMGEEMDKWLESNDNLEQWHDKLSARQRRILMTKWAGASWRKLVKDQGFITKLFQKTGCLITMDGAEDEVVRPQGLDDYKF